MCFTCGRYILDFDKIQSTGLDYFEHSDHDSSRVLGEWNDP